MPVQSAVLIYPMRSKDYTFETESTFNAYLSAFITLVQHHVDFRILPLKTMTVSLTLYNSQGKKAATLLQDKIISGKFRLSFNARHLSSGMYFFVLTGGNKTLVRSSV